MVARIGREYNLLGALEKVWKRKKSRRKMFLSFDLRICKCDHIASRVAQFFQRCQKTRPKF